MKFKVQATSGGPICLRCENGLVYERAQGERQAFCGAIGTDILPVPLDIVQCTEYRDRHQLSRFELEKVAWTIRTDRSGQAIGFEPPKKDDA